MARTYIPGFTNMLEQPEYFGAPARVTLPVASVPSVRPSAPPIMQAPYVQPSAPPIMQAPAVSAPYVPAVTPQLREASYTPRDMMEAGLLSERTMEPSEEFRRADPSFTRKISDINPYYTDPATGFFYNEDATRVGQYFTGNQGNAATAKGASGFAEFNPNFEYRLVNKASGDVVFSGIGAEGLTGVQGAAQRFAQEQGDKGDWAVEQFDPSTGQTTTVARDTKPSNIVGKIADIALPVAASFIPGVGPVLGAALGSAASSVAQGRSLENTLMRAGLSAATAGAMKLTGVDKAISGALNNVIAPTVSEATKTGLQKAAEAGLNEIIVSGTRSAIPAIVSGAVGSGLSSQLASMVPGKGANFADQVFQQPTTPAVQVPSPLDAATGSIDVVASSLNPTPFTTAGAGALAKPGLDAVKAALEQQAAQTQQQPVEEEPVGQIDVVATPEAAPDLVTGALSTIPAATPDLVYSPEGELSEIIAEQTRPVETEQTIVPGLTAGVTSDLVYSPEGELTEIIAEQPRSVETEQTTVPGVTPDLVYNPEGQLTEIIVDPDAQTKIDENAALAAVTGDIPTGGILPSGQTPTDGETTLETEDSVFDKLKDRLGNLSVADYMRLAALAAGLVGGGGSGGGGRGVGTIPAGLGSGFSPVFSARLPAPTLPGATGNFAPRTAADLRPQTTQDWYRYGYGPEQSFFEYVPQSAPNTSQAYTGYEQAQAQEDEGFAVGGMAGGGMRGFGVRSNSYAVNGPGTGRSDEIPALLSDGEYVIDAETVALLGDGSPKAGAERLDKFRVNVRKHKGSKLAKGEFSPNAKRPEHYLKGGRA